MKENIQIHLSFLRFYSRYELYLNDKELEFLTIIEPNIKIDCDQHYITSTIDNLIKGASGQAVQNMNLMFGFKETIGLV